MKGGTEARKKRQPELSTREDATVERREQESARVPAGGVNHEDEENVGACEHAMIESWAP